MPRSKFAIHAESVTCAGHALILGIAAVAVLCGRVVGVPRTPANIAVAVGMIVASGLLVPEAFGLLPRPWSRATWTLVVAVFIAFVAINIF